MHSSRIRTVRCSGRLWGRGWCLLAEVSAQGGVCPEGVSVQGVSAWGMSAWWGCILPPPLWTESLIEACENITFPQLLLWTVITTNLNRFSTNLGKQNEFLISYYCVSPNSRSSSVSNLRLLRLRLRLREPGRLCVPASISVRVTVSQMSISQWILGVFWGFWKR